MSRALSSRPLPGVRFEAEAPRLDDPLPRMDVAGFVGFAARGPLQVPVPIDDVGTLHAVFGEEAPLAWDPHSGEPVNGLLVPAIRAFFRNGGRRCWAVRVAGASARVNRFAVPALGLFRPGSHDAMFGPAIADASSAGSWADGLGVGASLGAEAFGVRSARLGAELLRVELEPPPAPQTVAPGDLLSFRGPDTQVLLAWVDAIEDNSLTAGSAAATRAVRRPVARCRRWLLVRPAEHGVGELTGGSGRWFAGGEVQTAALLSPDQLGDTGARAPALSPIGEAPIVLDVPVRAGPPVGSLLELNGSTASALPIWLRVSDVAPHANRAGACVIEGRAVVFESRIPTWIEKAQGGQRLSLDLWMRRGRETALRLGGMGFSPRHPRFWAALESAEERFAEERDDDDRVLRHYEAFREEARGLGAPLAGRRAEWPLVVPRDSELAVPEGHEAYTFPLDMALLPETFLGGGAGRQEALERDGLLAPEASLFLDPALAEVGSEALLAQAAYVRYQAPRPRPLGGIHSLLWNDEITLLAVPDAVHRLWQRSEPAPPPPEAEMPLVGPQPAPETFAPCEARVLEMPRFVEPILVDPSGALLVAWSNPTLGPGVLVELEQATRPDFVGAGVVYRGQGESAAVYGRGAGSYYHRIRTVEVATVGTQEVIVQATLWVLAKVVVVPAERPWVLQDPAPFPPKSVGSVGSPRDHGQASRVLTVHRAVLRMCAARGDMLAVLALPDHFADDATKAYLSLLGGDGLGGDLSALSELPFGEERARSFGALYHPWLLVAEEGRGAQVRRLPPDGAAVGLMAARAQGRGAWIAPANEPLKNVLGLRPVLAETRRAELRDAGVNLLVQGPRGFVPLSADTASHDEDVRPVNVRRLLMLLRRAALRLGQGYVFEPHGPQLRRAVERGFEEMLGLLFQRGAFAGTSPATSFEVEVDATLNPAASVDAGRLVVTLKVAPSLPLEFLTVRLVQTGDRSLVTEGR